MSKRPDMDFLADSKEAVLRITTYTENLSYKQFLQVKKPRMLWFAILKS